jgi:hypothetical protein
VPRDAGSERRAWPPVIRCYKIKERGDDRIETSIRVHAANSFR